MKGVAGTWKDLTDSVNFDGRQPDRPGAKHRRRDDRRGQRRLVEENHRAREGRNARTEETPSTRWWTSSTRFASEVTRVAREVGTEGKLGGQAEVKGVAGTWKDLTDSVNFMAGNLTGSGAKHRRRDDRRGQWRLVQEDHRGREGRNPGAEKHHQHDGGSAFIVRRRSDPRGPRSGYRRKTRRPGRSERRRRYVEGSDRLRELHGRATSPARCETSPP